jgi:hypothetical protein
LGANVNFSSHGTRKAIGPPGPSSLPSAVCLPCVCVHAAAGGACPLLLCGLSLATLSSSLPFTWTHGTAIAIKSLKITESRTKWVQEEEKADSDGQLLMEIQRRFIASRIFADLSAEPDLMGNQGLLDSDGLPRDAPTERKVARAEQVCGPPGAQSGPSLSLKG